MRGNTVRGILALALIGWGASSADAFHQRRAHREGTIEELLDLDVKPFAIAHHGFGDNRGEDPSRPIENTVAGVRRAFEAGASIVEVDVQLTRDGQVVAFHDDFLPDFTCLNQLSLGQLRHRLPYIPRLSEVLHEAAKFNEPAGPLQGLVIVELKAASPFCDPHDTQDRAIVAETSRVVRQAGMTRQVMYTSFSPALLFLALVHAPEIARDLEISGFQFLTAAEIQAVFGFAPVLIQKTPDLGLQWAEIGPLFRLPGYGSVNEVFATAAAVRARVVESDLFFLQSAGAPFVQTLHALGLKGFGFTATNPTEWFFLQSLGLDGIYTDDVPFGVAHEAPIP